MALREVSHSVTDQGSTLVNAGIILDGEGVVRFEERPEPLGSPSADRVRVRMERAGICGSDLHMRRFDAGETLRHRVTGIFAGHEGAGHIVGEDGPPVLLYHYEVCGACVSCRRGWWQWCAARQALSMDRDGAQARFVDVHRRNCLPIPEDFDLDDGCLIACTAGTAASMVLKLGPVRGRTALVIGLGPLGSAAAQLLHGLGAHVEGSDLLADRRRFAVERGIVDRTSSGTATGARFDLVIETTGTAGGRAGAIMAARNGGVVGCVGLATDDSTASFRDLIMREIRLVGSNIWPVSHYRRILDLYRRAGVRPSALVGHRFRLEDGPRAYDIAASAAGKVIFEPGAVG